MWLLAGTNQAEGFDAVSVRAAPVVKQHGKVVPHVHVTTITIMITIMITGGTHACVSSATDAVRGSTGKATGNRVCRHPIRGKRANRHRSSNRPPTNVCAERVRNATIA